MLLAASESSFLLFFQSAAVVMLPVGIFLRSFSLTRKIGGVVLAATIAAAVIYPAGILVSKEIYGSFRQDFKSGIDGIRVASAGSPPISSVVCSVPMQVFAMSPLPVVGGEIGWFLTVCLAVGWIPGMQWFCSPGFYKLTETIFIIIKAFFPIIIYFSVLQPYANQMGTFTQLSQNYLVPIQQFALPAIVKYSVLSIVVFLIPLIITMTLLRNFTLLFGGEPQLYGLSKLV
jgi:hypothetical protein